MIQKTVQANALHLPIASDTVQCVVTSPPYYGLRDYGTAVWSGGSPDCDHSRQSKASRASSGLLGAADTQGGAVAHKRQCPKCGAVRDDKQIGLEQSLPDYVSNLVRVFCEVRRVLRGDGVLWLNLGDSYESKNLLGVPWRVAFALQDDGWLLRQDIIWHKPNPMPESAKDRCTKVHEYLFMLTKSKKYFWDWDAMQEPRSTRTASVLRRKYAHGGAVGTASLFDSSFSQSGSGVCENDNPTRNKRSVWTIPTRPFTGAHFATFPPALVLPMILSSSRRGDLVLDPFSGAGTVKMISVKHGRQFIGTELSHKYIKIDEKRNAVFQPILF